jgi:hypothetical protein
MPFNIPPAWGADVPISMPQPVPAGEPVMVEMYGFGMTQYRLVHDLSRADYESLAVPVYAPANPTGQTVAGDAAIDATGEYSG